ncbi:SusC/RagA family TonB-linked outer membrane protein [Pseudoflavitalea sp. G-6-1-2]|uniref:SusC/RagA family TonB-linked outer membrane protein n=1 Tax=Pseudoflavitalea sp. G-6-1-2 TaxID=2728841 RepID=UPI00146D7BD4|nr:SusC/RagA family TonB-linked outer membrane protein [Pseudoflavitalea sp. G-6-1-2]NML21633.1 SusC/RagA family TonB-linked outer membrane protein [Pseudoflavitalea sp. G-6-1-2]
MRKLALLPAVRVERRLLLSFAFLFFMCCSTGTFGQVSKSPLEHKISFKVENATVTQSLKKLHDVTGINFSYRPEDLDDLPRVTLNLSDATTRAIIEKLLEGSNLQYVESAGGNILVMQKPKKKAPVKGDRWVDLNGKVVDQKGNPMPRVSIVNSAYQQGTTTNDKGEFNLSVALGSVLNFSFAGMKSYNYTVKDDKFAVIKMDTSPVVMQEFVVTGYQSINKRMVTGAVTVLTPEKFLVPGVATVDQMLQGKVPGMMTTFNSGSPSATPKIRIRGTSTILGNASPLWVVDGIPKEDPVNLSPLEVNNALRAAQDANFSMVGNAISGINPNDIESITVLKDGAAASIYGVRAANGVIVVKTKRGKAGPLNVGYVSSFGFTGRPHYSKLNLMNSKERVEVSKENLENGIYYASPPFENSYEGAYAKLSRREITQDEFAALVSKLETNNTDWFKLLAANKLNTNHSIAISGGSTKGTFRASINYGSNNGAMKGDEMQNFGASMNVFAPLGTKVTANVIMNANIRKNKGFYQLNPLDYATKMNRTLLPDEFYPAEISTVQSDNLNSVPGNVIHYNFLNEKANTSSASTRSDLSLTANLSYRILPNLTLDGAYNIGSNSVHEMSYATDRSYYIARVRGYDFGAYPAGHDYQKRSRLPYGGIAYPGENNLFSYLIRHALRYDIGLFEGRHHLILSAYQELRSTKIEGMRSQEPGYYPDRGNTFYSDYYSAGGGAVATAIKHTVARTSTLDNNTSLFGSLEYTIGRKYAFSSSIRNDGNNRFGQYSNAKFLPVLSFGARWNISEEKFLEKALWLNNLGFRASYGTQGNVVKAVGPNLIASYPTSPIDGLTEEFILGLKSLPYPDLRWEKTRTWNFGFDLSMFNNRINVVASYYSKLTVDMLLERAIPFEYGIGSMYVNYGRMSNIGMELGVSVVPVRTKDFEWTQDFSFSRNINKLTESDSPNKPNDYLMGTAVVPGMAYSSFYSYKFTGLDPQHGYPLIYVKKGPDGQDDLDPLSYLVYSGRKDPIVEFGTSTSLRYKQFSVTALFVVKLGNKVRLTQLYSQNKLAGAPPAEVNLSRELKYRWRKPGDEKTTTIPSFSNWYQYTGEVSLPNGQRVSPYQLYDLSDLRLADGSFLRCGGINVGWNVPQKILKTLGFQMMSINGSVSNPFYIGDKKLNGQDPEQDGPGATALPIVPSYNLGFNITF